MKLINWLPIFNSANWSGELMGLVGANLKQKQ